MTDAVKDLEIKRAVIAELKIVESDKIPVSLYSIRPSNLKKMLVGEAELSWKNTTLVLKFKNPILCETLDLTVKAGDGLRDVKVVAYNVMSEKSERYNHVTKHSEDALSFSVRSVISSIEITPPETIILSKTVKAVAVYGYDFFDIGDIETGYREYLEEARDFDLRAKNLLAEIRSERMDVQAEVAELEKDLINLDYTKNNVVREIDLLELEEKNLKKS
ncbi:hypothetical protein [uncultured Deefgea sp.]|uniref:hypothetical protein n=1 Tax=uncultured Deefgea sp. TaxID=1304914 RepID=UPI0026131012|nr:hypothetical protein [uncultured Deefgea sp.]